MGTPTRQSPLPRLRGEGLRPQSLQELRDASTQFELAGDELAAALAHRPRAVAVFEQRAHRIGEGARVAGLDEQSVLRDPVQPHSARACDLFSRGLLREKVRDAVFVQPSVIAPNGQMDGIPVPLIDAMAGGKAVIASAISGIPEVVVHEETGLLVDPANPRMLADAIRRLAVDPALRARLGARAREKVTQECSLADCTAKLIALFDRHNPELPA